MLGTKFGTYGDSKLGLSYLSYTIYWMFEGLVYGLDIVTNKGTKLGLRYGRVLGKTLGAMDGDPLGTYDGSDLGSSQFPTDGTTFEMFGICFYVFGLYQ